MGRQISETTRLAIAARANYRCEYCHLPAQDSLFAFHIDHIISIKHGGTSDFDNLAYACQICNLNKGTDIATFLEAPPNLVRLFNPRLDLWEEHFQVEDTGALCSQTNVGLATIKVLDLNHPESIIERRELIRLGLF